VVSGLGDPLAVAGYADQLARAAGRVDDGHDLVKRARPQVWSGSAADAYVEAATGTLEPASGLARTLRAGSGILARYAEIQRETSSSSAEAQHDFDRAAKALRENPLDLPAALDLARSRIAAFAAAGRLQQAASAAAEELRAAAGLASDARPWWDPFGWFNDPQEPDEKVTEGILGDDEFDPDDVSQGSIGDCFMLTTIVSLLGTDAGDEFIRDHIRWDADAGGYWVTIYPNGVAKEIFVEYVFDNGARNQDWQFLFLGGSRPSIAALYEAALMQEYGYYYLDGGDPSRAMEIITGSYVVEFDTTTGDVLADWQLESAREALADGGQAVVSSPSSGENRVTVTAPDGSTREVEIVSHHAYTVTRIEADGSVWVRNPWGPGNSADGGGEFRVDAEDARILFHDLTYTNVTDPDF